MDYTLVFVFGLVIGSFLNVVIDRMPKGKGITLQRSNCDKCKKTLKWFELIPIFSFIILKRKCRYCQEKISWQYPLVELGAALLFVAVFSKLIDFILIPKYSFIYLYLIYIVSVFLVIFVIDLKYFIVPDKIILPAILISLFLLSTPVFSSINSLVKDNIIGLRFSAGLLDSLYGVIFFESIFLTLFLVSKGKWLGFGDVKLGLLVGIILGFKASVTVFLLTFFSAGLIGIILMLFYGAKGKTKIPLASFISASTLYVILSGFNFFEFIRFY